MKFPNIMRGRIRLIGVIFLFLLVVKFTLAQSSIEQLKREQAHLEEKIALANKLLSENKSKQKDTEWQLALLAKKIDTRKKLVANIGLELADIHRQQKSSEIELQKLRIQKASLADSYAEILQSSYRSKLMKNRWLFLFSAQSLPQLYRRWRYLKQLNDGVQDRLRSINETAAGIDRELAKMVELKQAKEKALSAEEKERKILDQDISKHKNALSGLGKEASKLRSDIKAHHAAQEKLKAAILKSISNAKESSSLPSTPAMARLSTSFANNKGKLPWPVSKGLIVKSFGKQAHPTLRNVTIVNNGVDITTDPGALVKTLFEGVVVGQQFIPGYDNMVIVSHGNYYTVYSYLSTVMVAKGEKIATGEAIGIARSMDGMGQIHLEIWQGKELLDPQSWLKDH